MSGYTITVGKGKGDHYRGAFGGQTAEITEEMGDMTLKQFAETLAKQYGIKDGDISLFSINFNFHRAVD